MDTTMKTRCPNCNTLYAIDSQTLDNANGMARCYRCNTVFDTTQNPASPKPPETDIAQAEQPVSSIIEAANEAMTPVDSSNDGLLDFDLDHEQPVNPDAPNYNLADGEELPFDIPDDLPELLPSDNAALNVEDTLDEQSANTPWWQIGAASLLALLLAGQFAWQQRVSLVQYPLFAQACNSIDCRLPAKRDLTAFKVQQRQIGPSSDRDNALTLYLRFSNDANFAQSLPDLQLSMFDSNESLLVRRRLKPSEYISPAPPGNTLVEAKEVITIELQFEDPGRRATGFKIDFL